MTGNANQAAVEVIRQLGRRMIALGSFGALCTMATFFIGAYYQQLGVMVSAFITLIGLAVFGIFVARQYGKLLGRILRDGANQSSRTEPGPE